MRTRPAAREADRSPAATGVASPLGNSGRHTSGPPKASLACPACGGANPPDAVFCANSACHKALGEFRFVREELQAATRWHERMADRVTTFVGKPHFLVWHAVWFAGWVALNAGVVAVAIRFDDYPFGLLSFILAIEAVFITGFLLISSNRQSAHADLRGELDYEVSVLTYRRIQELDVALRELIQRLDRPERDDPPA